MAPPGDYLDEMDRMDPRLIDAALQGRETGEPALDRAALVVADLRRVLLEEPLPEATGTLEAMAAAAGDEARGSTPVLSRHARGRRLATMPLAAVLVLGAGLAWGAVGLPEQASDTADEAVAAAQQRGATEVGSEVLEDVTHGQEVSAVARDDSLQGCEKGMAVSEVASSKGNKQGPGHDPCAKGAEGKAGAEEASAKGKQIAEEAKAKAQATAGGGASLEGVGKPENAGMPESPGSQGGGGKP
jgi:hypothetical protein